MKYLSVLVVMVSMIFAVACSGGDAGAGSQSAGKAPAPSAADKKFFEEKCSTCHPAERGGDMKLDRAGWQKVVERMQKHASGMLSDEDATKAVDYLVLTRGVK